MFELGVPGLGVSRFGIGVGFRVGLVGFWGVGFRVRKVASSVRFSRNLGLRA